MMMMKVFRGAMRKGSKFGPTSSRLQAAAFSETKNDEGGSRAVDFGRVRCSVKYSTTHTNRDAESRALSEH